VNTQPLLLVKNQCCYVSSPTNIPLGQGGEAVVDEEPLVKELLTNGVLTGSTIISSCSSLSSLPGFPSACSAASRGRFWTRNILSPFQSLGPACDRTTPYRSLQGCRAKERRYSKTNCKALLAVLSIHLVMLLLVDHYRYLEYKFKFYTHLLLLVNHQRQQVSKK
jgi:hypothetical protein